MKKLSDLIIGMVIENMARFMLSLVNTVDFELISLDSDIKEMEEIEGAVRQF